ncbi:MAG: ankyrin repeat domain-containing protein [Desulfomonilaceae bacterium]
MVVPPTYPDELIHAAYKGQVEIVEKIVAHGTKVDAKPNQSTSLTALQAAAGGGRDEVVRFLLLRGAKYSCEAMVEAENKGHKDLAHGLLWHCNERRAKESEEAFNKRHYLEYLFHRLSASV